jgi:uncharacterized protein (TIGR00255 family)
MTDVGRQADLRWRLWAVVPVIVLIAIVFGMLSSGNSIVGLIGHAPPPADEFSVRKVEFAPGEITIATILQAPGVMRFPEEALDPEDTWPAVEGALRAALADLIKMREREGKHLAKDLIHRLKAIRKKLKEVRALHPDVVKRYRAALLDRIQKAGLPLPNEDERVLKEITFFADRADVSEELTRLESHLSQFAHHLRKNEPVGRTLEFMTQEISRELNTLGAKANDAAISQHVVACKAELEKIREQIQNLE